MILSEEELIVKDFEDSINEFKKSLTILNKCIETKTELKFHNINNIMKLIKYIALNLFKEYWQKEKAHQNTSGVKSKYNELISLIQEYDKTIFLYKEKFPNSKIESFRQTMKRFNTGKVSVKTEIFNY